MIKALVAWAVLAAGTAVARPAPEVAINRPPENDPVLDETTLRMQAELATAGYLSRVITCRVDQQAGPVDCPRDGTMASIALVRDGDDAMSMFVSWMLSSGLKRRRQVHVTAAEGGADPTLLAVRAVELLRDLQLEVAVIAQDPEDPKPLEPFAEPPSRAPSPIRVIVGAAGLLVPWSNRPPYPAFGVVVGVGARAGDHVLGLVEAAVPFSTSLSRAQGGGDAQVWQGIGTVGIRVSHRSPAAGLFVTGRVGLSYLNFNAPGFSQSGAVPVLSGGVGYAIQVGGVWSVSAEAIVEHSYAIDIDMGLRTAPAWWPALQIAGALTP